MPNVFEYEARIEKPQYGEPRLEYVFRCAHEHADFADTSALCEKRKQEDPKRLGFLVCAESKQDAIIRLVEINRTPKNLDGFYIL